MDARFRDNFSKYPRCMLNIIHFICSHPRGGRGTPPCRRTRYVYSSSVKHTVCVLDNSMEEKIARLEGRAKKVYFICSHPSGGTRTLLHATDTPPCARTWYVYSACVKNTVCV